MKLGHHTRPSLCSFLRLVALLALIGGVAGCASTQPPPATDISGMWQGTWVNMTVAGGGSGQIEMTVTQTGAKYVGHILMTGLDNHPTGPTLGFVTGNEVEVAQPRNWTGRLTVVGDQMTGELGGVSGATVTLKRVRQQSGDSRPRDLLPTAG